MSEDFYPKVCKALDVIGPNVVISFDENTGEVFCHRNRIGLDEMCIIYSFTYSFIFGLMNKNGISEYQLEIFEQLCGTLIEDGLAFNEL